MYSKMLIPLDGSKTTEKVLPYARYLDGKLKIPIELLAVIDIAEMATHIAAEKARYLDTMIEDGVRASTTYLRGIATTFPGDKVTCTVEKGRAEDTIIEKGEADAGMLITMATHGRSGLNRFLLGSVAEKVLRGSANPLLLIRAADEAKGEGEAKLTSIVVPLDGAVNEEIQVENRPQIGRRVVAEQHVLFDAIDRLRVHQRIVQARKRLEVRVARHGGQRHPDEIGDRGDVHWTGQIAVILARPAH